jgi:hypothetical protein
MNVSFLDQAIRDSSRAMRRCSRARAAAEVVGLPDVEHPEVPQHRDGLDGRFGRLFAALHLAIPLRDVVLLVEDDQGGVLTAADLPAMLADLPVGAPERAGIAVLGGGESQQEHVDAAVGLPGGHRPRLADISVPGFVPRDGAALQRRGWTWLMREKTY